AALVTALVAVFVAGAPLLALSAGRWAHDGGPRPGHAQRAGWHEVPAVAGAAPIRRVAPSPGPVWAPWTAPGGGSRPRPGGGPGGGTADGAGAGPAGLAGRGRGRGGGGGAGAPGPPARPARAARQPGAGRRHGGRAPAGRTALRRRAGRPWRRGPAPPGGVGR